MAVILYVGTTEPKDGHLLNNRSATVDSNEEQQLVPERITGVLCLVGALAAIGGFFAVVQLSSHDLYLQLGVTGAAGAIGLLGTLQLGQAFAMKETSILQRLKKGFGFFLGFFGALLLIGAVFEVMEYPNGGTFLRIGLLGTAATLVLIGGLKLGEVRAVDIPDEDDDDGKVSP